MTMAMFRARARAVRAASRLGLAAGALVLAVGLGGCGDDDAEGAPDDPGPTVADVDPDAVSDPGPDEEPATVTMAAINVLHGLFCPAETDFCDAPARLDLLWQLVEEAGCPDLLGLSEIGPRQQELVPERIGDLCDGRYELLWDPEGQGQIADQEMILTTYEVIDEGYVDLANFPWGAHWAQVRTPLGVVDFVTTHFASGANNPPCEPDECPPICPDGIETGTCHTLQIIDFLDARGAPDGIHVVSNDLNATIDSDRIAPFLEAGFVDAWLEAGQPECDPETGAGCTCCIGSEIEPWDGGGLGEIDAQRRRRIDFVLVRGTDACTPVFDAATTVLLGGDPVEPAFEGLHWPSDHAGVVTELSCA